jgi:hypothetical protein
MREGAPSQTTLRLRRALRDIVTDEQYKEVIESLIDIALASKDVKAKVAAIKIIIEYTEGKPTEKMEHTIQSGPTIKEILGITE